MFKSLWWVVDGGGGTRRLDGGTKLGHIIDYLC